MVSIKSELEHQVNLSKANNRIAELEYIAKNQTISIKSLSERFIVLSGLVEHHCHCVHTNVN